MTTTITIDELLLTIQARGWRLHTLYSYPDDKLGLLRWGASIKLTAVHRYAYSIAKLSPIEALEDAIADATTKQREDWRPTLQDLSLAAPPPRAPSLDDIFGAP